MDKRGNDLLGEFSFRVRASITRTTRKSKFSREQIADKMSELMGRKITASTIYNFSSESHHDHRFPAELLPFWIKATGDNSILELLAEASGCQVLSGQEALYADLARLDRQAEEIKRKRAVIRSKLP